MSGIGAVAVADSALDTTHFARWSGCVGLDAPVGPTVFTSGRVGLTACGRAHGQGGISFAALGSVRVAADARIDALRDLRHDVLAASVRVTSSAKDAELIASAYLAWGERCVDRLRGDFAFVLWDEYARALLAARDHFGVRQLYYAETARGLVLSSSAVAVYRHPWVNHRLDDQAVVDFLVHDQVAHDATMFTAIRRLPAGHTLWWAGRGVQLRRYWTLEPQEPVQQRDRRDYSRNLLEHLREAVRDRTRGGAAGVLMSGGLDSPAVAAVAAGEGGAESVRTYTAFSSVRMPDAECGYAELVRTHLGLKGELHDTDPYVPLRSSDESQMALPLPDSSTIGATTIDLLRRVAAHGAIALTGIGPDGSLLPEPPLRELRGRAPGRWLRVGIEAARHAAEYRRRPPVLLRHSPSAATVGAPEWLTTEMRMYSRSKSAWSASSGPDAPHRPRAHRVMNAGWSYLLESYGGMGAVAGVNVAHPFLDLRVVTYCLSLPSVPWCWDKHVLREAISPLLPYVVTHRRKSPLRAPWLKLAVQETGAAGLDAPPHPLTRRYYAREGFAELAPQVLADPYVNLRPLALDSFVRRWESLTPVE